MQQILENENLATEVKYKLIQLEDILSSCLNNMDQISLKDQNEFWENHILNKNPFQIHEETLEIFEITYLKYQICYHYKQLEINKFYGNDIQESLLWIAVISKFLLCKTL